MNQDKEFYELGEKMFDHMNPPGTPEFKPYFPKREWVGLTDEEHTEIAIQMGCLSVDWVFYGAAIERRLKEKNT